LETHSIIRITRKNTNWTEIKKSYYTNAVAKWIRRMESSAMNRNDLCVILCLFLRDKYIVFIIFIVLFTKHVFVNKAVNIN